MFILTTIIKGDYMSKTLVAFFSASGSTKGVAEKLAIVVEGDLYEIEPEEPYIAEDLDWTNPKSRSSIEMKENRSFRPPIKGKVDNINDYNISWFSNLVVCSAHYCKYILRKL